MNDFKDALTRVADASAPTPLSLEQVRGRAKQIRRRRTTTAVLGTAAAVAAIAGLGVAIAPSDSGNDSVPPASQTADATPSATPTAQDANAVGPVFAVKLAVPADQTSGAEPRVPYWSDGQIIDSDGSVTPFPDRPATFVRDEASGDWVVVVLDEAHADLVRVTDAGQRVGQPVPTFERGLAVGPRGEIVTLTQHNTRTTLTAGDHVVDLGTGLEWSQIYGVMPNGDVVVQGADGVEVVHLATDTIESVPSPATAVTSVPTGLVAYGRSDGTWEARDPDGATRWTVDWAGVNSFSPNGRYVALVGDREHRIPGSTDWDSATATSTIWIRTAADLLPVAAFVAPENGYFGSWTWDGDELLADLYDRGSGEWSLVRLSGDGFTVGRGTAQKGGGEQPAYVFGTQ
ncbi:hypothetical protein SAMN04487968_11023 [Nocardioides terrae]|uniref:Uncharacterized protein n=1 Tax=Nocardioides terrae TaxID=574651 RepID=A0A1I1LF75_9ACTN|nr:hypothetical protein [Nocardioides terrae]SFC71661.1 hypothetical protein SAMN04487968_11023 [Nocardioides terrae]